MKNYATLTVIGRDRTGVVARFTDLLFRHRLNIESLEEQVLRGQFSMTLQASWIARKPVDNVMEEMRPRIEGLARVLQMEPSWRALSLHAKPRIAILVTKEDHVLRALLEAKLPAEITFIAGSYPDLEPIAKKAKIPFYYEPWKLRVEAEQSLLKKLADAQIDAVVLARFMKILSPNFVWRWKNKIINIHPSLLPSFPGANAYRQAYEKGVKIVGVTAHFVTPGLDEGPILWQEAFRVTANWSLREIVEKGQTFEARATVKAVQMFLTQRQDIYWGKVHERRDAD